MPSPIASLPRALSKLGICSRTQAEKFIAEKKVLVNGKCETNIQRRVHLKNDTIEMAGAQLVASEKYYFMMNKPRGYVTTTSDEQRRKTVFECFPAHDFPYVFPAGRLDKASEGLLLFTNDSQWAERITAPKFRCEKKYHVQIGTAAYEKILPQLKEGIQSDNDFLVANDVVLVRSGQKNSWLEIVLVEGRNRHIRRMMSALHIKILRLIRISIGTIRLGTLPKGQFRTLTNEEILSIKK